MWKRIDLKHRLKNDGKGGPTEPETALARRLYGLDGAMFPRMVLSIHNHKCTRDGQLQGFPLCPKVNLHPDAISIGVSRCEKDGIWHSIDLPAELILELIEMLEAAKVELEKQIAYHELMEKNHVGRERAAG